MITLFKKINIFKKKSQTPNTQHLLIPNKRTTTKTNPQPYDGKKNLT